MNRQEFETKLDRLHRLMREKAVGALWLTSNANIAWLSGGNRTYIDTSSESGIASVLVTTDKSYLVTNNIEGLRLGTEEGFGGWEIIAEPWHQPQKHFDQLTKGLRVASDQVSNGMLDVRDQLIPLRAPLTPPEIERYRALGHEAGAALANAARAITPGMSEHEAAALVAKECHAIGAIPTVVLVASDERFRTFRHPLPTARRIEKVVMLVVCARRHGLFANLTRIVHVGPVEEELQQRMAVVAQIEARTIAATRPGACVADIFEHIKRTYADAGFEGEWKNHHQGGACSYGSRDYVATPDSDEIVRAPQAFAWNPSVPGAKSEDTVLITDEGAEILTPSPDWPTLSLDIDGQRLDKPVVLEL